MTITAAQLCDEIDLRKNLVDDAIMALDESVKKKLKAEAEYDIAEAKARVKSVVEDDTRREADHKANVTLWTRSEKLERDLQREMLKAAYKVLDARCSQMSATQTQSKIVEREMRFVQTGPQF